VRKILYTFTIFIFSTSCLYGSDLNIFSVGFFDFNKQKNEAIDFRFDKRFDETLFDLGPKESPLFALKPFYGIEATSDSAIYVLGGIYVEEKIGKRTYITPNIGVGAYDEGDGKKLGSVIEFRSTIEISYELKNSNRIGASIGHISNAGIDDKNPGTEIISFSYQIPF
tara:strand:+ start:14846 stop:15349 length:504 start_codon:yes stop_codon:yes gene_type:complete